mmetsp:Transcript_46880/g.87026  ORF Transcript_46880/g.87026 Transcript_46880/m.87026 type:complete len:285 (-) Transcript_46880:919-1773(-)
MGCLYNGTVAGNLGLGAQNVKALRAGDAGDGVHGEKINVGIGCAVHEGLARIRSGPHKTDESLSRWDHVDLVHTRDRVIFWLFYFYDDVRLAVDRFGIWKDLSPMRLVLLIVEASAVTCARLNKHQHAMTEHFLHCAWDNRDTLLAHGDLGGNAYLDERLLLQFGYLRNEFVHDRLGLLLGGFDIIGTITVGPGGSLNRLDGTEEVDKLVNALLGIAEKHRVVVVDKERVVDTGISYTQTALHDNGLCCLPDLEDRHASNGTVGVSLGGRVYSVICTNDKNYIG